MNYAIMPEKLYNIIDKDIIFIDIRDSYQFNNLHIKNFINLDPSTLDSYPLDKSKPIC